MLTKSKIASPLSRKAVLLSVNVSQWEGRKLDRKVTKETNERYHASDDAGRFNKLLLEKHRLEEMRSVVSRARDLFNTYTKPWSKGTGILPNKLYNEFADKFRVLKREFNDVADRFCAEYPMYVEERRAKLNGMFNESDYPSADLIRSKFKMDMRTMPVPDINDFRSDVLDADTIEDIKREMAESSDNILTDAMKDSVDQMKELIGHMATKLKTYGTSADGKRNFFQSTLVENVRDLAKLLPAFNLTDDPAFDAVVNRIERELCVEEYETLRDNEAARESVAKSADDILKDVEALLG